MIRINDIKLDIGFTDGDLRDAAAKKLRISGGDIVNITLVKKSLDARKKDDIHFVCAAELTVNGSEEKLIRSVKGAQKAEPYKYELPKCPPEVCRPVVAGFGPAGIFAALILAQCGQKPIVIERGLPVDERKKSTEKFWRERVLDTESNVQFGEGGAGAFSDGKLNTGTKDIRIRKVLEELVSAGAPEEILWEAKPHVGTDRLPETVKNIREKIIALGGEVRFSTKLTGIKITDGHVSGAYVQGRGEEELIECDRLILAVGHSARDTFQELCKLNLPIEPKPFSVGARIEHPASVINEAQYGRADLSEKLGAADYKLFCHLENGRGVYTFCMCPGGTVTGAASEEGGVVTNGMSNYARDGENSNAALLVGVDVSDLAKVRLPDDIPPQLAGVEYQRIIERAAFKAAGSDYSAPAQRVADFLERRRTNEFTGVKPTYLPSVSPCEIDDCLPEEITQSMRAALPVLGRKLKGFDMGDAVLTAPETRSSSPLRILRGEDMQSLGVKGLFPCGEGAGYAGGIVSAAVDGIRCAEAAVLNL